MDYIVGWEPLKAVIVGTLILRTEPELATKKEGSPGEDFFWSIFSSTKTGVLVAGWIGAAIWALAANEIFVVD